MAPLSSSSGKPLMLKDFLRDDPNSDSCDRFRTVPRRAGTTVRYLLAVEFGDTDGCGDRLLRTRSKGALTKISEVIRAVRMFPFTSSAASDSNKNGILSRSFSKKLRKSFWRKQREKNGRDFEKDTRITDTVRVRDIVRLSSFGNEGKKLKPYDFPSPIASCTSSSGWSEIDSSGSDRFPSSSGCSEFSGEGKKMDNNSVESIPNLIPTTPHTKARSVGGDCCREPKVDEMEGGGAGIDCICQFEEKEQLSPVSVMDFPYEEEEVEEDAAAVATTSFHQSLANVERTKHQLLQKIRRFESLAELVDPVDLDGRFTYTEDVLEPGELEKEDGQVVGTEIDARARVLLSQLQQESSLAKSTGEINGILVDFFIEGLRSSREYEDDPCWRRGRKHLKMRKNEAEETELLRAAKDWINGHWRVLDLDKGEMLIKEMDRNGRWRSCFEEETEEIAAVVEAGVCRSLLAELLLDLFN